MWHIKNELKIIGINAILISGALTAVFVLLALLGGELLHLSCAGFEVFFPVFCSIAVGEWGKMKADDAFDIIAAQSPSVFPWILRRFTSVFGEVTVFATAAMTAVSFLRQEVPVSELFLLYFAPAFFLSTLAVLSGICFSQEHIPALLCGMTGLLVLMLRSLLRVQGMGYVYLFIRFAGDPDDVWLINKAILCGCGLLLWYGIFTICDKRKYSRSS